MVIKKTNYWTNCVDILHELTYLPIIEIFLSQYLTRFQKGVPYTDVTTELHTNTDRSYIFNPLYEENDTSDQRSESLFQQTHSLRLFNGILFYIFLDL